MSETRDEVWQRLGEAEYDLLIIGCGITGAGALRDAARRGLKVAVVDANDIAYGTSSRSSKLVHGGLRYLEHMEFSLVFEAVSERRVLQNIAPHLVNPLGFLFPIFDDSPHGVATMRAGLMLYDGLSLFRSPKLARTLSKKDSIRTEPLLRKDGLRGGPLYYDCATDDARLTLETVLDGAGHGAAVLTYGRVTGLKRDPTGRVIGATVQDQLPGPEHGRTVDIHAKAVINATGPWTDNTRALGAGGGRRLLKPTKGVHIVVPFERMPLKYAVVCRHPTDKRVLFCIPWGDMSYIGTTDTYYEGRPEDVAADWGDVSYLLDAANYYFPDIQLVDKDVVSTWAGLRPLIMEEGASESQVSREHEIRVDADGLITIAGGKLTTYRRMGAEVVSRALDLLVLTGNIPENVRDAHTGREPLPGAVGWPESDDAEAVAERVAEAAEGRLPAGTALHLAERYGTRGIDIARYAASSQRLLARLVPDRPEIMALVDWAVTRELAQTLSDVMVRRTQLYFRDLDQGLSAVEAIAERMGELLDWSEERRTEEILAYQAEVALSRRWKTDREWVNR
ncbi:MAG: glycerol-3-phosphate dehydrogenase/oxidase [Alphaproteobacteria bacterium]|nr:glycerol-3-phosphate dehydrogenase/oxidase [Alphaproteobacteria bacterium]MCB9795397.1 glycerol-3-phosphate dehydrogenase/oxidase [Alphaproteobacteria bacterium]